MRLYSSSLPTLALFVNVVCLFLVLVFEPAVCVKLYNDCSNQFIAVYRNGSVFARDDPSGIYQNLTITSVDIQARLTIFAEASRRYLCFTKGGKLIGSKKNRGQSCLFNEEMLRSGYTRYRSVMRDENGQRRYIGFTKRGKLLKQNTIKKLTKQQHRCINFLKQDTGFDVSRHNGIVAGLYNTPPSTRSSSSSPSPSPSPSPSTRAVKSPSPSAKSESSSQHHTKLRHKNHHHHHHHHQNPNNIT